jgi:hypothetical protein
LYGKHHNSKPLAQNQPKITSIRLQSSAYGAVVPLIYGTQRISGKLIWYGDFTPIAHAQQVRTGGGKKSGGGSTQTETNYTYTAAVAILLCEGQINSLGSVWDSKGKLALTTVAEQYTVPAGGGPITVSQAARFWQDAGVARDDSYDVTINDFGDLDGARHLTGIQHTRLARVQSAPAGGQYSANASGVYSFAAADAGKTVTISYQFATPTSSTNGQPLTQLNLSLFSGSRPQTPWSYLTSKHPGQDLSYAGIAYVASSAMDLGSSGDLPNLSYEVVGQFPFGGGALDANPKEIISDFLTNPFYGAGFPAANLGDLSSYSSYCMANGIFLSLLMDAQKPASEWLREVLDRRTARRCGAATSSRSFPMAIRVR